MTNRRRLDVGKLLIEIRRPDGEVVGRDHYGRVSWDGEDGRAVAQQFQSHNGGTSWSYPLWLDAAEGRLHPTLCGKIVMRRPWPRTCGLTLEHKGQCE